MSMHEYIRVVTLPIHGLAACSIAMSHLRPYYKTQRYLHPHPPTTNRAYEVIAVQTPGGESSSSLSCTPPTHSLKNVYGVVVS